MGPSILGHFADIAMATYALESALLRTRKRAAARGEEATQLREAADGGHGLARIDHREGHDRVRADPRRPCTTSAHGADAPRMRAWCS
jgi:hypothetical protein